MNRDDLYEAIGARIRDARRRAGLTQEQLAVQVGLSRASVTNVELGRQSLLVDQLVRFASVLQLDPAILVRAGASAPPRSPARESVTRLTPETEAWLAAVKRSG